MSWRVIIPVALAIVILAVGCTSIVTAGPMLALSRGQGEQAMDFFTLWGKTPTPTSPS
jgi:hypothetical protein